MSALANVDPKLFSDLRSAHVADDGTADAMNEALQRLRHLIEEGSLAGFEPAVDERLRPRGVRYPAALRAPLSSA